MVDNLHVGRGPGPGQHDQGIVVAGPAPGRGHRRTVKPRRTPEGQRREKADPGRFMGQLWASAPGPRVSPDQADLLGSQIPAGARVNATAQTITFTTASVRLMAVASPADGPDETFRIAGLVNPDITVPVGAQVSMKVINADPDTGHGLVITASQDRPSWMPMMTDRPAFAGSAVWFLGNPTTAGIHTATLTFTATTPGTYQCLCPVPGHAQEGMTGLFTVSTSQLTGTGAPGRPCWPRRRHATSVRRFSA